MQKHIAAILALVIALLVTFKTEILEIIEYYFKWITEHPVQSPIMICFINFFAVIFMLPYSVLAIGTGWALN